MLGTRGKLMFNLSNLCAGWLNAGDNHLSRTQDVEPTRTRAECRLKRFPMGNVCRAYAHAGGICRM